MSVPVQTPRRFYGVLNGAEKEGGGPITEKDFKAFQVLANTLAFFLENQGLFKEIKESEKTRFDEMSSLFHEIRIPLTCFQEAVAILKDELSGPLNPQQRRYIEIAERNIHRLKEFIDVFIRWARKVTEGHLLRLERRKINLTQCGEGILEEEQERIFDRFYRLKKAREKGIEGHGLGLTLRKEIVEAHQGKIGVDRREGRGSIFWFELPTDVRVKREEVGISSGRGEA